MRVSFILIIFIITYTLAAQQSVRLSTQSYIELYKDIAIYEMQQYGIPASIKLGQGILESASGNSELAKNANNHFGIKCKSTWEGRTYHKDDDAKDECFRKYEKVLDSYEDHSQFLKQNQRYAFLFELKPDDYKAWAHGLKKAGYATNPRYAELLIKTIEEHQLYRFDIADGAKLPVVQKQKPNKLDKGQESVELEILNPKSRAIAVNNRVKFVRAKEGESIESLAKEMDIMPWQLYKYNDLNKNYILSADEIIYLQPKRKKAITATHIVQQGESLIDVSRQHAVKLKSLYKMNGLSEGDQLKSGTKLKLR